MRQRKSRATALVVAGLVAAPVAFGGGPSSAQPPLPTSFAAPARIAFVANDDIHTIAADGSDRRRLTTKEGEHTNTEPAWSPDGRSIAFVRDLSIEDHPDIDDFTQSQIWLMDRDGGNQRPYAPPSPRNTYDTSPAWSPDGDRLVFARLRSGSSRPSLIVMGPDGTATRTLVRERAELESPAWSPDGTTILYSRTTWDDDYPYYDRPELWSVPADGGAPRRIARDAEQAAWSPDGKRIAFVSVRDKNGGRCGHDDQCSYAGELYVANADGTGSMRLTSGKGDERAPSWSADGERIVFQSDRNFVAGEKHELYSIRPDGSCITWLTNGTAQSGDPAWEPGAGPTDPGGCGGTPREPLIEVDVAAVQRFTGFPVYWLGATSDEGLMLDEAYVDPRGVDLGYGDCAHYDGCRAPLTLRSVSSCRAQILWLAGYAPRRVTTIGGALVYRPEVYVPHLYVGPTQVSLGDTGSPRTSVFRALRRANGESRPGEFPRAQLPEYFWHRIERAAAARRKYGTAGAARRLKHSPTAIKERDAIHRRLRELGRFGRLRCR